jgi:hypothetical protein
MSIRLAGRSKPATGLGDSPRRNHAYQASRHPRHHSARLRRISPDGLGSECDSGYACTQCPLAEGNRFPGYWRLLSRLM